MWYTVGMIINPYAITTKTRKIIAMTQIPAPTEKQVRLPINAWKLADKASTALSKQKNYKVYTNALVAMAITEYVDNHPELQVKI